MKEPTADSKKVQGDLGSKETKASKLSRGLLSTLFGLMGRSWWHTNDCEKRLQNLSKKETTVNTRLQRRAQIWEKCSRSLVLYSVVAEVLILVIAILVTRSPGISWQVRAIRALPVFALPALSTLVYSSCANYYRMCECRDEKTLERLRAERQAEIDELKEKTNFYVTQQLIQKYDLDPTTKAAAAIVLMTKLGSEAGISLDPKFSEDAISLSHEKNQSQGATDFSGSSYSSSSGVETRLSASQRIFIEDHDDAALDGNAEVKNAMMVSRRPRLGIDRRGEKGKLGWIARVAAMLVGEDPSHSYALICRKCYMHNGLSPKEEFQHITYFCPHCHSLNGGQPQGEGEVKKEMPAKYFPKILNVGPEETSLSSQTVSKDVDVSELAENLHPNIIPEVAQIKKVA